jgi:hypothetical protein
MKARITATPIFKKRSFCTRASIKKNRERRPRIAKTLEVNTMKTSVVTPKIAGMESTANITSATSTTISTISKGVAHRRPS